MKKKILVIALSLSMIFSTTGITFADTDLDNFPSESTKVEKEVEEPTQEKTEKKEVKDKEVEKEQSQEENKKEESTIEVKKEESTTEIKAEESKRINLSKNSETKNENIKADPVELSITFKYIDRNTKEWTEYIITDSHDNRTIGIAKANNVIANHKTVTDGLVVKTFTGWDTEFPVTLNQNNPTVVVTAQYDTVKKPQLTFKYTDNISTGSGSWQNQSPNESYNHTFKNPLVASPRTNYTFLYWENVKNSSERYSARQKYKCNSSTITEDTTVEFIAVYEYQPEVKVLYHYKNGIKDTGAKSKAINIYTDPQTPKSIKHWFYDEEGGEPIQRGELVSLPEKLTPITKEPAAEDKVKVVNVYAHYHGVTFVDEDGESVLKEREEYQYDTAAEDIEKPENPTKEATAQYTFFFDSWLPTIVNVIEEAIYQASYRSEINKYTVTWVNEGGATLEVDENVPYGDIPEYNGNTPTKKSTAQYSYQFNGWTPTISEVTGDTTYTATYKSILRTYTITWVNEDGTELEADRNVPYGTMPSYDGETPTKESTVEYNYTFSEWTPEIKSVTEDAIYTAVYNFDLNKYTVTYAPGTQGTFEETSITVEYGSDTPTAPETTCNKGYKFDCWNPIVADIVIGDAIYVAQWKKIEKPTSVNPEEDDPIEPNKDDPITPNQDDPTPPDNDNSKDKTTSKTTTNNTNIVETPYYGMGDPITVSKAAVPTKIKSNSLPLAAPEHYWALLNLLLALITCLIAFLLVIFGILNKNEEDEETKVKNKWLARIISIGVGILSLIIFFLTEDMNNPWIWVDNWTWLMAIILLINIIVAILAKHKEKEKDAE